MLKSKDIADYFEAKLSDLRPGETLPFAIYLYFSENRHIIVWKREGDIPTDGFLDKYLSRGMQKMWVHRDDTDAYFKYLNLTEKSEAESEAESGAEYEADSEAKLEPVPALAPEPMPAPQRAAEAPEIPLLLPLPPPAPVIAIRPAEKLAQTFLAPQPDPVKKAAQVAQDARRVIAEIAQEAKPEIRQQKTNEAKAALEKILEDALNDTESVISEIWHLSKLNPEFEHATNVAVYATLIAMAFGRIQAETLHDLALAALIHDIGLSQIPLYLAAKNWQNLTRTERVKYATHVDHSVDLIGRFGEGIPPRVRQMIGQHHEKFDGTGYPAGLSGFRVSDIAQLLSVADFMDSICEGIYDGESRSLIEAFALLQELEESKTFPQYFNPEVFSAVSKWIRRPVSQTQYQQASDIVKAQAVKVGMAK